MGRRSMYRRLLNRARHSIWAIAFLPALVAAQTDKPGSVSGFVHDAADGEALISATVFLKDSQAGTTTNLSGYYVIPSVPVGRHTVICTYIGYEDFTREIELGPGEDLKLDIEIRIDAIETAVVVIRADSMRTADQRHPADGRSRPAQIAAESSRRAAAVGFLFHPLHPRGDPRPESLPAGWYRRLQPRTHLRDLLHLQYRRHQPALRQDHPSGSSG
jgi:hypothetical protein